MQVTREEVFTHAYAQFSNGQIGSEEFFNIAWNAAKTYSSHLAKPLAESAVAPNEHGAELMQIITAMHTAHLQRWSAAYDRDFALERHYRNAEEGWSSKLYNLLSTQSGASPPKTGVVPHEEKNEVSASHECGSVPDEQIAWNVWNDCHYIVRQSTDIKQATWSLTLQREQIVRRAQSKAGMQPPATVEQEAIAKPDSVNFDKPIETATNPRGGVMRDLLDADGENRAVRTFLQLYGGESVTTQRMRNHLTMSGFEHYWPDWTNKNEHLTKAGAQIWLRYLFSLERAV